MSKIHFGKIDSFSNYYKIDKKDVDELGFFDITLNIDSKLYIDSRLLDGNSDPYFSKASTLLKNKFAQIIKLLEHAKTNNKYDMFWKKADELLTFKEIHGTCLGYSDTGTVGNAIGPKLRKEVLQRMWELIQEGRDDPELFELICVFMDGIGCDRVSDLIVYMIQDVVYEYNENLINALKLIEYPMVSVGKYKLLENPYREGQPIILLPKNILSDLPVCFSFEDMEFAVSENEEARKNIQSYIDFNQSYKKADVFRAILNDEIVYEALINKFKKTKGNQYNFKDDPRFFYKFRDILNKTYLDNSSNFYDSIVYQEGEIDSVVQKCIATFKHLVENCGMRNSIYESDEKLAQILFYAVSYLYCEIHNVCFLPEVNTGRGPVDFFLAKGLKRISAEIKKTSNPKYLKGITEQLPAYMESNDSQFGYYIVLNVDSKDTIKITRLFDAYNKMPNELKQKLKIVIINCFPLPSASKL